MNTNNYVSKLRIKYTVATQRVFIGTACCECATPVSEFQ